MAKNTGQLVVAQMKPYDDTLPIATHEAKYGKGGMRTVQSLAERDAITIERREEGMEVYVIDTGLTYRLASDLLAWTIVRPAGEGAVLAVTGNAIAPTNAIHHVGAGLIKNITVPTGLVSGQVYLIPDAAFTWDTTGNIAAGGVLTAVVGKVLICTYSSSTGKWYTSY